MGPVATQVVPLNGVGRPCRVHVVTLCAILLVVWCSGCGINEVERFRTNPERITVVLDGASKQFYEVEVKLKGPLFGPGKFFLATSGPANQRQALLMYSNVEDRFNTSDWRSLVGPLVWLPESPTHRRRIWVASINPTVLVATRPLSKDETLALNEAEIGWVFVKDAALDHEVEMLIFIKPGRIRNMKPEEALRRVERTAPLPPGSTVRSVLKEQPWSER